MSFYGGWSCSLIVVENKNVKRLFPIKSKDTNAMNTTLHLPLPNYGKWGNLVVYLLYLTMFVTCESCNISSWSSKCQVLVEEMDRPFVRLQDALDAHSHHFALASHVMFLRHGTCPCLFTQVVGYANPCAFQRLCVRMNSHSTNSLVC